MRWVALALAGFIAFVGCGYQSPSVSAYLSHIKTIRIPQITNQTTSFELADELTAELQRRFDIKWNTGDDSLLLVTAYDYDIQPRRFDVNNLPEQYRMSLRVNYEFSDNVNRELIAQEDGFEFYHDFYVVAGRGEVPEDEDTARQRLVEELVLTLYNQLAEQW